MTLLPVLVLVMAGLTASNALAELRIMRGVSSSNMSHVKQLEKEGKLAFKIPQPFGADAYLIEGKFNGDASWGLFTEEVDGKFPNVATPTGQIILFFKPEIGEPEQLRVIRDIGFEYSHAIYGTTDTLVVNYPPSSNEKTAVAIAKARPEVRFAEPNHATVSALDASPVSDFMPNREWQSTVNTLHNLVEEENASTLQAPMDAFAAELFAFADRTGLNPSVAVNRVLQYPDIRGRLAAYYDAIALLGPFASMTDAEQDALRAVVLRLHKVHFVPADYQTTPEEIAILEMQNATWLMEVTSGEFVEPATFRLDGAPNDPLYAPDPATGFLGQWDKYQINAEGAWDLVFGSVQQGIVTAPAKPRIAILDTAIDIGHEDLGRSRFVLKQSFVPNDTAIKSALDASDLCPPDDELPSYRAFHGTSVAGIAAALGNNNIGVAGMSWNTELVEVVTCYETMQVFLLGPCLDDALASAIRYAANNNAKVINGSLHTDTKQTEVIQSIAEAADYAIEKGSVLVFATGNSGENVGFPASLASTRQGMIAVGAVDINDTPWPQSNNGPELSVWAPSFFAAPLTTETTDINKGVPTTDVSDINGSCGYTYCDPLLPPVYTCANNFPTSGNYSGFGGTSAAAPAVSGLAALLLSLKPNLTPSEIKGIVISTAAPVLPGSAGRIDAQAAVENLLTTRGTWTGYQVSIPGQPLSNVAVGLGKQVVRYVRVDNSGPGPLEFYPVVTSANPPGAWMEPLASRYIVAPGQYVMVGLRYSADQLSGCTGFATVEFRWKSPTGLMLGILPFLPSIAITGCTATNPGDPNGPGCSCQVIDETPPSANTIAEYLLMCFIVIIAVKTKRKSLSTNRYISLFAVIAVLSCSKDSHKTPIAIEDDSSEDNTENDDTTTTEPSPECIPLAETDITMCQGVSCNSGFPCLLNCDYCPISETGHPGCKELCPVGLGACTGPGLEDPSASEGVLFAFDARRTDIVEPLVRNGLGVLDPYIWPPAVLELDSFDASHSAFCGRLWINKGYEFSSPISDQSLRNVMAGPSLAVVVDFRSNPLAVVSASPSLSADGFDYQFFGMRADSVQLSFVVSQTDGRLDPPDLGAYDWNLDHITDPDTGSDRLRFENMPSRVTSRTELGAE